VKPIYRIPGGPVCFTIKHGPFSVVTHILEVYFNQMSTCRCPDWIIT